MQIISTAIPLDQAFAHVANTDLREALTTGTWHPLVQTHRGRLHLARLCTENFAEDIAIPPVGVVTASRIDRGLALIDMDRFNHKPEDFLLALRSYWLA